MNATIGFLSNISYISRAIADFIPNFVAMAEHNIKPTFDSEVWPSGTVPDLQLRGREFVSRPWPTQHAIPIGSVNE